MVREGNHEVVAGRAVSQTRPLPRYQLRNTIAYARMYLPDRQKQIWTVFCDNSFYAVLVAFQDMGTCLARAVPRFTTRQRTRKAFFPDIEDANLLVASSSYSVNVNKSKQGWIGADRYIREDQGNI